MLIIIYNQHLTNVLLARDSSVRILLFTPAPLQTGPVYITFVLFCPESHQMSCCIIASMASKPDPSPTHERADYAEFSIATAGGLAFAFIILFFFAVPMVGKLSASRDFISYWATGQQLVHHGNPYDRDAVAALQHSEGLNVLAVLIMRNPPWALPIAYPLGFLPLRLAGSLWSLILLTCLLISVRMVRELCGSPPNHIHWLGFAFTPGLICLTMGQTPLFALLGLVLFLRLHRIRPFAAGAALWLCALKPHLFLPFVLVLLVWIVVSRSYRILLGSLAAFAADLAVTACIDPAAWNQYAYYMRTSSITHEFTPCLGNFLRDSIHPSAEWLAFLPCMIACVWALAWFWPRRRTWDWLENGSLLMLVSLLVAPFGWVFDQTLAIPALMHGAYATRSRKLLAVLALIILVMDGEICFVPVISPLWLWTAPAFLAWYLLAHASTGKEALRPPTAAA